MIQYLCVHGLNVRVETELEYLLQLLKRDYRLFFVEHKIELVDIDIRVIIGEGDKERCFLSPMGNLCAINKKGIEFYVKDTADEKFYKGEFRKYFTAFLSWNLYVKHNALCFHSSCVSQNNTGIVFMGESGSGKTSLAVELAVNNFNYMSNELTFISAADDNVKMYGMPQEINLGQGALEWFEKKYPERFKVTVEDEVENFEYTDKNKRIYTQKIFDKICTNCFGGVIVFPEKDFDIKKPVFEKIPPENLAIKLMEYFLFPSEWKFRPNIKDDNLEELEKIFIDIANKMIAFHFRWTNNHEKNRKVIQKLISEYTAK